MLSFILFLVKSHSKTEKSLPSHNLFQLSPVAVDLIRLFQGQPIDLFERQNSQAQQTTYKTGPETTTLHQQ